ncbi:MAG: hypothetical protein JWO68_610 [Actinomycetia bacterium]|nr:hypothetical protein [Actinomycetes bacterium]
MSRAGAAVLLLLTLLAGAVTAPSAAAQSRTHPAASVRLVEQTAWLGTTGAFELRLAFADVDPAERLDLAVTLHERVSSRSSFDQSLKGRPRGTRKTFAPTPIGFLAIDGAGNRVAKFPLPATGVASTPFTLPNGLRPGVYPVTVALQVHGGAVLDSFVTHLVRYSPDGALAPLSVAWIQPVGAASALHADGSRSLAPDERSALAATLGAVAGSAGVPMTLDVTPETVAALAEDDLQIVRQALARGDQLLASPYVDVDPSALVGSGFADDLTLQRQVGEDTLFATLGDHGDPRTWTAPRPLTSAAASRLRSLGVTRFVVPEASLEPLEPDVTGGRTLSRPFALDAGGDDVEATSVDPGLLAHFRAGSSDQVLAAHHLLADLAVLFFDSPGTARGAAIRPPEGWRPNAAFLDTVMHGLADAPILHPVTVERLFDDVEPISVGGVAVVRSLATDIRIPRLPAARLGDAHRAFDQLVALVGPAADVVPAVRDRLLAAESSRLSAAERNALLNAVIATRDRVRDRLELPNGRTFRLTAREGTIPLTLVNGNPWLVRVDLVLSSDKLEFTDVHDGDRSRQVLHLELQPGNRTLTIPVRARASARFPLQAALLSPDGAELRRSRFTIISTVFSGVGIVLSIGAGLFLLLWWGSHWRTVRRGRRLVEAAH